MTDEEIAAAAGPTTRAESINGLEHEFGVLIRRVKRVIGERAKAVHPDLQVASFLILSYLADSGPRRSSELAELFGMDKGAVSRQVQHLVDLRLIHRAPDPADGRAAILTASDEGLRRLERMAEQRRQALEQSLGDWSDEELASFVATLGRYNRSLG